MSIGMFDGDICVYGVSAPNLELMKLSTYYKKRREIVVFTTAFSPQMYTKFIYRKDIPDGRFIPNVGSYSNVEFGGRAFTQGVYKPLKNEIEFLKPDMSLYQRFYSDLILGQKDKHYVQLWQKSYPFRLSIDGKEINSLYREAIDFDYNAKTFMVYDDDVTSLPGARPELQTLLKEGKPSRIAFLNPLNTYNLEELVEWIELPIHYLSAVRYNGVLSEENFVAFAQAAGPRVSRLQYNVGYNIDSEQDFVENHMLEILKQLVFCRTKGYKISLIYGRNFELSEEMQTFIDFLNFYVAQDKSSISIIEQFRKSSRNLNSIRKMEKVGRALNYLKDKYYDVFCFCYEYNCVTIEGGTLCAVLK